MKTKNKTDKIRFGVIGCGYIGSTFHCPNLKSLPNTEISAYSDICIERAENLLKTHGGKYVTDNYNEILEDKDIDAVLIQVGPRMHPEIVCRAARAGKHIFVEKPIAVELQDALKVVKEVEKSGVKFIYGTHNRLSPMVKMAKSLCPNPLYSYCQCTGSITSQACHNFDLAVNVFHRAQIKNVYATGRQAWNLDPHLCADSFSAVINFCDDSTFTYIQHGKSFNTLLNKFHFQLFGNDRCVYLANRFRECHLVDTDQKVQSWIFKGDDMAVGKMSYMGHYNILQELVNCILNGGNGSVTIRDAAFTLAVEKAVLESVKTGSIVDFKDFMTKNNALFLYEGRNLQPGK